MRTATLFVLVSLCCCTTAAEKADPANRGNIVFSLTKDSLETSRPGEYSSGDGDANAALLVLAHAGNGSALRAAQSGSGSAAHLVAAHATETEPALRVESAGEGPAARFTGGRVVVGDGGTLVMASVVRVQADEVLTVPKAASVVLVAKTEGRQANKATLPAPVEGQLLIVANDDDDPVAIGDERVAAGETRELLFVGGRFRVLGGAAASPPASRPAAGSTSR